MRRANTVISVAACLLPLRSATRIPRGRHILLAEFGDQIAGHGK